MKSYLSLMRMHEEGPGSLAAIFGPDGDSKEAPRWAALLWEHVPDDLSRGWWTTVQTSGEVGLLLGELHLSSAGSVTLQNQSRRLSRLAFDLRVRSVFLKISEKCAQALGDDGIGWRVEEDAQCYLLTNGPWSYKWPKDGTPYARAIKDFPVVPGAPWESPEHFLTELALILAPRIAELETP